MTTSAASAADRAKIAEMVRAASTSFYEAMRLLPKERRDGIFAVYAFCREVDDIADDDGRSQKERIDGLNTWRVTIDQLFNGHADTLISRALAEPITQFGLRRDDFIAIIDGMEMDATGPIVAPDEATFDLYCDRVASAVGRLCVCIFGDSGPDGRELAHYLGRALQVTNILRDVDEDAGTGRLYLPRELLTAHGVDWNHLDRVMAQPGFPALWRQLAERAEGFYGQSRQVLARCDRKVMRPARIMMEVYHANLVRMRQMSDEDLANPAISKRRVGKAQKLMIALRHGLF